jgi:PAS domain S-box-containing protein
MQKDYRQLIFDNPITGFAYYRAVFDDMGKPVDLVFLEMNETFEKLTGIPRKELINKSLVAAVPGIDRDTPIWDAINKEVLLGDTSNIFEYYVQALKKWYGLYIFSPEKNHYIAIFTDITEQKKSIDLLRKYEVAIEQSPASVVIADVNTNITYINKKFTELTGYTREEVIGQKLTIILPDTYSKGRYDDIWKTLKSGKVWSGEFMSQKKNGELIWEEGSATPISDDKGKIISYIGLSEDVTKRRLAEKQLHKLSRVVEQSPNMILITNLDFVIEFVNDSFVKISGYSAKEIVGKQFKLLKLAKANEEEYKEFWKILNSGQVWSGERIDKRKNGELYWQLVFVNPFFDEDNKIVNYVATIQDISDRKKVEERIQELNLNLEQKVVERTSELSITNEFLMREMINRKKNEAELKKARDEAEKSNRAKSEFISRMSHELRTPMNSILGFAQLFSMGTLTETQRKGVDHILNSGKHLLRLINEVLDISKIESGKFSMSVEEVNVNESILEAIDLMHPLTTLPQVTVQYETRNQDELYVRADKQRLIQILVNILNNAIKYNKQGGDRNSNDKI